MQLTGKQVWEEYPDPEFGIAPYSAELDLHFRHIGRSNVTLEQYDADEVDAITAPVCAG